MRATMTLCLACVFSVSAVDGQELTQRDVLINFEGNKAVPSQQLLDVANECLAKHPQAQRRSPGAIDYCLAQVRFFLTYQGYLRAAVGKPRSREDTADGVRVTVPVEEGARYRLGEVTIEGARLFPPAYLLAMFDLKSGDVAGSGALLEWLDQRVKRVYAERGHIQYFAYPEPNYRPVSADTGEGIVDFKIEIDEGRLFTVRKITFVGNRHLPEQSLRRALLIGEGDTFNQSLFDDGIRNLNRLGLFEEIDGGGKDVTWRSADRSGQLDLIIHLKEKARP